MWDCVFMCVFVHPQAVGNLIERRLFETKENKWVPPCLLLNNKYNMLEVQVTAWCFSCSYTSFYFCWTFLMYFGKGRTTVKCCVPLGLVMYICLMAFFLDYLVTCLLDWQTSFGEVTAYRSNPGVPAGQRCGGSSAGWGGRDDHCTRETAARGSPPSYQQVL